MKQMNSQRFTIFYIIFLYPKLKSSYTTYPTSNAKSLTCDTANEHALTCSKETCSQTAVQWNQWQLSIHTHSNGKETLFRQLTPPCKNTYMSTPGNTAKLVTAHSNIKTAQSSPSLVGSEPIYTIH